MKAYRVFDTRPCCFELVFAKTEEEARKLALSTRIFEYAKLTDMKAKRMERADKFYKEGKWHLDWDNMADKKVYLELGWNCLITSWTCARCDRRELCSIWNEETLGGDR